MIVYLHGFNSSPQSHKAQVLGRYLAERGMAGEYACPALPPLASDAIREAEKRVSRGTCFIGSSLGGFYATWLAEKHGDGAHHRVLRFGQVRSDLIHQEAHDVLCP